MCSSFALAKPDFSLQLTDFIRSPPCQRYVQRENIAANSTD
jgi:hypothetical protein